VCSLEAYLNTKQ